MIEFENGSHIKTINSNTETAKRGYRAKFPYIIDDWRGMTKEELFQKQMPEPYEIRDKISIVDYVTNILKINLLPSQAILLTEIEKKYRETNGKVQIQYPRGSALDLGYLHLLIVEWLIWRNYDED